MLPSFSSVVSTGEMGQKLAAPKRSEAVALQLNGTTAQLAERDEPLRTFVPKHQADAAQTLGPERVNDFETPGVMRLASKRV